MKIKGQNLLEISFIGLTILLIGLFSLFLFSKNIDNFFEKRNPAGLFSANRTLNQANINSYLSNVKLHDGNITLESPVETVIRSEMLNNTIQTSGSSGNLTETAEIIKQYADELQTITIIYLQKLQEFRLCCNHLAHMIPL